MTIELSNDYQAIKELLMDPKCWRRMAPNAEREGFEVGPIPDFEYVTVRDDSKLLAVFIIIGGAEVHFCFSPCTWGKTLAIAKDFLVWAWENLTTPLLIGPIPRHNRLALRLAKQAGFEQYRETEPMIYTAIARPL